MPLLYIASNFFIKTLVKHITQSLAIHMSLQATSHRQEVEKLNQRISELEERYEQLQEQYEVSRAEVAKLRIANQNSAAEVGREAQDQRLKIQPTLRGEINKAQEVTEEVKFDMAAL